MARRRKSTDIVGGFTTLAAARRAVGLKPRAKGSAAAKTPKKSTTAKSDAAKKKGTLRLAPEDKKIRRTIQPTKHSIVCYECEYAFVVTGRLQRTFCPKCKSALEAEEHFIDREWSGTLKTIGQVKISPDGVVTEGTIRAGSLVLGGTIKSGTVKVFGFFEVHAGGRVESGAVESRDLVVQSGARIDLAEQVSYRDVDIAGEVRGNIDVTGVARIRAGGLLRGQVRGGHLTVDEGGGLRADVSVTPEEAE